MPLPAVTTGGFSREVGASLLVVNDGSGNPVPASAAAPVPVSGSLAPAAAASWSTDLIATVNPGTGYATLGSNAAKQVMLINDSGVSIQVRRVGATNPVVVRDGGGIERDLVANTNEVQVKRKDDSNSPVNVGFAFRS